MRYLRILVSGAAVAAMAATATFGGSHSQENPAVKARKAQMALQSFNAGPLFAMAKGDMDFDAGTAQAAADNLVALTGMNMMRYWPEGTSNADIEGTRALPAIWEPGSEAQKHMQDLHQAAMTLAENAGTLEGVQSNIGAVGGACGACHKAYRAPE